MLKVVYFCKISTGLLLNECSVHNIIPKLHTWTNAFFIQYSKFGQENFNGIVMETFHQDAETMSEMIQTGFSLKRIYGGESLIQRKKQLPRVYFQKFTKYYRSSLILFTSIFHYVSLWKTMELFDCMHVTNKLQTYFYMIVRPHSWIRRTGFTHLSSGKGRRTDCSFPLRGIFGWRYDLWI